MELSHSEEGDAVAEAAADDTGCGSGVEAPDATDVSEALREGGPGAGCPSLCEVFEGLQGPGYGVARPADEGCESPLGGEGSLEPRRFFSNNVVRNENE